jgi:hypothetical protein
MVRLRRLGAEQRVVSHDSGQRAGTRAAERPFQQSLGHSSATDSHRLYLNRIGAPSGAGIRGVIGVVVRRRGKVRARESEAAGHAASVTGLI